jgi:hypothetical protein
MDEQVRSALEASKKLAGETAGAVSRELNTRLAGRLDLQLLTMIGVIQGLALLARVTSMPYPIRSTAARMLRATAEQLDPPTGSEARH